MLSLNSCWIAGLNKSSDNCRHFSWNFVGCSSSDMIAVIYPRFRDAVLLLPLSQANPDCRGAPCRQSTGLPGCGNKMKIPICLQLNGNSSCSVALACGLLCVTLQNFDQFGLPNGIIGHVQIPRTCIGLRYTLCHNQHCFQSTNTASIKLRWQRQGMKIMSMDVKCTTFSHWSPCVCLPLVTMLSFLFIGV